VISGVLTSNVPAFAGVARQSAAKVKAAQFSEICAHGEIRLIDCKTSNAATQNDATQDTTALA
jgi:hypothetical protein